MAVEFLTFSWGMLRNHAPFRPISMIFHPPNFMVLVVTEQTEFLPADVGDSNSEHWSGKFQKEEIISAG